MSSALHDSQRSIRRRIRRAQRAAGRVENLVRRISRPLQATGFPYRSPSIPRGVEVPDTRIPLGADYDTEWARRPVPKALRAVLVEGPLRLAVRQIASPEILGLDRLADLADSEQGEDSTHSGDSSRRVQAQPVIFAPNHHSHIDTGLMIRAVPGEWRHKLIVAAAADYFFDARWKAAISALALNAIPIDRDATGRRSADLIRDLIDQGHSLVIYPEGGRSPDGWGQSFKGGAAYISARCGVPVVPVFIDGTGVIFGKGAQRLKPGRTRVIFGSPLWPQEGENTRRFNARIEAAVTLLGDESLTDFWSARQRAARKANPSLSGPEVTGWRRHWALTEHRRRTVAGLRRPPERKWPSGL
jgi:1-acyl-sn-glycerol-3-phosphate acyltransferase